ncbi:MAG: beta galactosidase jelly roll domain-containing protein [Flavobacterium sp.]|nr:beta galactosidase jelly roll domain-containing protein [Pedobacter sp.]
MIVLRPMINFPCLTFLKVSLTVAFISLFFFASGQDKTESSLSINGSWKFKIDPHNVGEREGWTDKDYLIVGWDSLAVPGNWDTRNEYSHYNGKVWYQKSVTIPQSWKNKKIYLNFDGVNFYSKVWLNGKLLGSNNIGSLPFQFNVSDLINRNGENNIMVCADNTFRLGATWNWGGIRRPVTLLAYDDVRIALQHITPTVDLQKRTANVDVKVYLENSGTQNKEIEGSVEIKGSGLLKKTIRFKTNVSANSKKTVNVKFELNKREVHLWHFDDPYLYDCTTIISDNGKLSKELKDRFGVRKIEVDNKNYTFKLNGESVRLVGFNLVPEDRTTGSTLPLWRIKADIDDMKALGCNMTRITHAPLPKEMYDYLDERGIMVFPEVPLWGAEPKVDPNNPIPKAWLDRLIENNYNHPSIIGWSVGNEIGENPQVLAYIKNATELAKSLDPTRLAVAVSHTAWRKDDMIDYSELGLVNSYSANLEPSIDKIHLLHPEKLLFYSEYGVSQTSEDLNTNFNFKGLLDSIRYKPYLMGTSLWTYNDYRSDYKGTKGYTESRPWGVVNDFRQRKNLWYAIQKEHSPVKTFKLDLLKTNNKTLTAVLSLTPRVKLDLPAYIMNGYRIVWRIQDKKNQLLAADFLNLPTIKPGDMVVNKQMTLPEISNAAKLVMELVSPLNYVVTDTTIFFSKPTPPKLITSVAARTQGNELKQGTASIRVVFEQSLLAQGYKVKYGKQDLKSETPLTVSPFIDVKGLNFNQNYMLQVVAVNSNGESEPSQVINISTDYAPLPPVIKYTEPADNGVFIGYDGSQDDYLFEVRYTTVSGNYKQGNSIKSTTKGVLFVPNLENGKTYYFQMKRFVHNSNESVWSQEFTVIPDGGLLPQSPKLEGIIHKGSQGIILFEPKKKALGYVLNYRRIGDIDWKKIHITAAQINQFQLVGLEVNKQYEFKLATVNENGISNFSEIKKEF